MKKSGYIRFERKEREMYYEEPYKTEVHCDTCNTRRSGTEYPEAGYYFSCDYCANPPVLVGLYRRAKIKIKRKIDTAKYYATTTAEEREARREQFAKAKAKINARRAAEGRPLIGEKAS